MSENSESLNKAAFEDLNNFNKFANVKIFDKFLNLSHFSTYKNWLEMSQKPKLRVIDYKNISRPVIFTSKNVRIF